MKSRTYGEAAFRPVSLSAAARPFPVITLYPPSILCGPSFAPACYPSVVDGVGRVS